MTTDPNAKAPTPEPQPSLIRGVLDLRDEQLKQAMAENARLRQQRNDLEAKLVVVEKQRELARGEFERLREYWEQAAAIVTHDGDEPIQTDDDVLEAIQYEADCAANDIQQWTLLKRERDEARRQLNALVAEVRAVIEALDYEASRIYASSGSVMRQAAIKAMKVLREAIAKTAPQTAPPVDVRSPEFVLERLRNALEMIAADLDGDEPVSTASPREIAGWVRQTLSGNGPWWRKAGEFEPRSDDKLAAGRCGCCNGTGDHRCGHECSACDGSGVDPDEPSCRLPHGADCRCDQPAAADTKDSSEPPPGDWVSADFHIGEVDRLRSKLDDATSALDAQRNTSEQLAEQRDKLYAELTKERGLRKHHEAEANELAADRDAAVKARDEAQAERDARPPISLERYRELNEWAGFQARARDGWDARARKAERDLAESANTIAALHKAADEHTKENARLTEELQRIRADGEALAQRMYDADPLNRRADRVYASRLRALLASPTSSATTTEEGRSDAR